MAKTQLKEKWEEKYEIFKSGKMTQDIQKLASELEELRGKQGEAKFSEYKDNIAKIEAKKAELEDKKAKFSAIDKNKEKIENTLNVKGILVDKTIEIIEKIEQLEKLQRVDTKTEEALKVLDAKNEQIIKKIEEIEDKLKNPELSEEEKEKLQAQKTSLRHDRDENSEKYSEYFKAQYALKEKLPAQEEIDKLKLEKEENLSLISQLNWIGRNLVKGRSIEEISAQKSNHKFAKDSKLEEKIKMAREARQQNKAKGAQTQGAPAQTSPKQGAPVKTTPTQGAPAQSTPAQPAPAQPAPATPPVAVSEFDQKHPKIAAVKNWFVEKYNKFLKPTVDKVFKRENSAAQAQPATPQATPAQGAPAQTQTTPTAQTQKESNDYEYIKRKMEKMGEDKVLIEIADKGILGFKESLKVEAINKLNANKEAATQREAQRDADFQNRNNENTNNEGQEPGE